MQDPKKVEKKGDKSIGKYMFFFKNDDYGSAAHYYDQSIKIYKYKKDYISMIRVYKKLIKVNTKLNDNWMICKNYEGIINCLVSLNKDEEIMDYLKKLIDYHIVDNSCLHLITTIDDLVDNKNITINIREDIFFITYENLLKVDDELINREDFLYKNLFKIANIDLEKNIKRIKEVLNSEVKFLLENECDKYKISNYCFSILFINLCENNKNEFEENYKIFEKINDFIKSEENEYIQEIINLKQLYESNEINKQIEKLFSNRILKKLFPANLQSLKKKIDFKIDFGEKLRIKIYNLGDDNNIENEEFNPF